MSNVLFQNVSILDRNSPWDRQQVDVYVSDGTIQNIALAGKIKVAERTTIAAGGYLSPGWVDMRCQLSDPGHEQREDLSSLAAAGLAGGFTTLITQPNSDPAQDNAGQIRALKARVASLPLHILPMAALSVGAAGKDLAELYDMHQSGAVAFTDGRKGTQNAGLLLRALQYVQPFGGLIVQSPLDQSLAEGEMVAEGPTAVRMGMKGMSALAETLQLERDLGLLSQVNGRLHIGPIVTLKGLEIVSAAKKRGLKFTTETTALHLLLDATENERFDAVTKIYPPLQDLETVEALRSAVLDGTIDMIGSGHHPQSTEDKMHDFVDAAFGVSTLETTFAAVMTATKNLLFDLAHIIECIAVQPRELMSLPAAAIVEGGLAELTHFDPRLAWTPSLKDIHSKCKYNPLIGRQLKGRALGVYVKGAYHPVS